MKEVTLNVCTQARMNGQSQASIRARPQTYLEEYNPETLSGYVGVIKGEANQDTESSQAAHSPHYILLFSLLEDDMRHVGLLSHYRLYI